MANNDSNKEMVKKGLAELLKITNPYRVENKDGKAEGFVEGRAPEVFQDESGTYYRFDHYAEDGDVVYFTSKDEDFIKQAEKDMSNLYKDKNSEVDLKSDEATKEQSREEEKTSDNEEVLNEYGEPIKKEDEKKGDSKKTSKKKKAPAKTLVIVESPTKAATIEKYLGTGYVVKASVGHVIDLPKSRMAIDVDHGFQPEYITVRGKAPLLKDLQKEAKKSAAVLLASDNDREGEAIAWHLNRALGPKTKAPIQRIVFNEITPNAILKAVKNPRAIIESKVDAQKARRVLDRLVGYNLSPLLWAKVKNGLSAGRVQSVALRLICEREDEVVKFLPEEYWSLEADFIKGKSKLAAQLVKYKNATPELKSEDDVQKIMAQIKDSECIVENIKNSEKTIKPKPPFTTSKLQQTAANKLGFTSKKTMQVAQQLYEGIVIGANHVGLITYMRTDSVRISDTALKDVREFLRKNYPQDLPEKPNEYAVGKSAQDAHEGIRPTYVEYKPDEIKEYLTHDQYRLYAIIWERFVSSQMTNAKFSTMGVEVKAGDALFRLSATKISEKGYYDVIKVLASKEDRTTSLPALKVGEVLAVEDFRPEQHFTQGPSRYTDASIVRMLEEKGIGRPSTYATIISVLLDRYYVTRNNKQLVPTQLGIMINKILVESFPEVINEEFTAQVELDLDKVEAGNMEWNRILYDFYGPFKDKVDYVNEHLESIKGFLDEKTDKVCDKCGKPMVKKLGRYGFFLACSGFPACLNTKSIPLAKCPCEGCDGEIVERKTKGRGKSFYGCSNFPKCKFISHFKPIDQYCPKCGWFLVEKFDKKNGSYKSCINPDCDYLHTNDDNSDINVDELVKKAEEEEKKSSEKAKASEEKTTKKTDK